MVVILCILTEFTEVCSLGPNSLNQNWLWLWPGVVKKVLFPIPVFNKVDNAIGIQYQYTKTSRYLSIIKLYVCVCVMYEYVHMYVYVYVRL